MEISVCRGRELGVRTGLGKGDEETMATKKGEGEELYRIPKTREWKLLYQRLPLNGDPDQDPEEQTSRGRRSRLQRDLGEYQKTGKT